MVDWLLLLGLVLWRAGFACQIAGNWVRHGLTHVPWSTLLALLIGSMGLAVWGVVHTEPLVVALSATTGVLDCWLTVKKARDWICTRLRIPVRGRRR